MDKIKSLPVGVSKRPEFQKIGNRRRRYFDKSRSDILAIFSQSMPIFWGADILSDILPIFCRYFDRYSADILPIFCRYFERRADILRSRYFDRYFADILPIFCRYFDRYFADIFEPAILLFQEIDTVGFRKCPNFRSLYLSGTEITNALTPSAFR